MLFDVEPGELLRFGYAQADRVLDDLEYDRHGNGHPRDDAYDAKSLNSKGKKRLRYK